MSPRSKEQFEEMREVSHEKILNAAIELFGTRGFESTSINDIVTKAGVSKGLMYHYFESKEDLVRHMVQELMDQGFDTTQALLSDDPHISLRNIFDMFFKEMRENFQFWKLITKLSMEIEKFDFVHKMARDKAQAYIEILRNLLEQTGWENPENEARILGAIFDGIGIQYYILQDPAYLDQIEEILLSKYCEK